MLQGRRSGRRSPGVPRPSRLGTALLLGAAAVVASLPASPLLAAGNVNFSVALRSLDDEEWAPLSDQIAFGGNADFDVADWPVRLAFALHFSDKSRRFGQRELQVGFTDLSGGVIYPWDTRGPVTPYVGGSLSVVLVDVDTVLFNPISQQIFTDDESDLSLGILFQGGFVVRLGEQFNLGLDTRIMMGTDVELSGRDTDADYFQTGVLAGWGW